MMEKTGYTLPLRRSEIYEDIPDPTNEKVDNYTYPQRETDSYEEVLDRSGNEEPHGHYDGSVGVVDYPD